MLVPGLVFVIAVGAITVRGSGGAIGKEANREPNQLQEDARWLRRFRRKASAQYEPHSCCQHVVW